MTWHRGDPTLYQKEKAEVEAYYPDLHFAVENDLVYVRGSFALMFEGQVLDRYSVELQLSRNHPTGLPTVRETGGRIPRCPDRHVNAVDGTVCAHPRRTLASLAVRRASAKVSHRPPPQFFSRADND